MTLAQKIEILQDCPAGLTQTELLAIIAEVLVETYSGNSPNLGNPPPHDYIGISYIGATNNIDEIEYKTGGAAGTVVATWTMGYQSGGAANDDLLTSVTKA